MLRLGHITQKFVAAKPLAEGKHDHEPPGSHPSGFSFSLTWGWSLPICASPPSSPPAGAGGHRDRFGTDVGLPLVAWGGGTNTLENALDFTRYSSAIAALAAGDGFVLTLLTDGSVLAWGERGGT